MLHLQGCTRKQRFDFLVGRNQKIGILDERLEQTLEEQHKGIHSVLNVVYHRLERRSSLETKQYQYYKQILFETPLHDCTKASASAYLLLKRTKHCLEIYSLSIEFGD